MSAAWLEAHGFSELVATDTSRFYERVQPPTMSLECQYLPDETEPATITDALVSFDLSCHTLPQRDVEAQRASLDTAMPSDCLVLLILWCITKTGSAKLSLVKASAKASASVAASAAAVVASEDNDEDEATGFSDGEYESNANFDHRRFIPEVPSYSPHLASTHIVDIYVWGKALRNVLPSQLKVILTTERETTIHAHSSTKRLRN
jgi:hypothetical protein